MCPINESAVGHLIARNDGILPILPFAERFFINARIHTGIKSARTSQIKIATVTSLSILYVLSLSLSLRNFNYVYLFETSALVLA